MQYNMFILNHRKLCFETIHHLVFTICVDHSFILHQAGRNILQDSTRKVRVHNWLAK